jgi:hypothetical protein
VNDGWYSFTGFRSAANATPSPPVSRGVNGYDGFNDRELKTIEAIVEVYREDLVEAWNE